MADIVIYGGSFAGVAAAGKAAANAPNQSVYLIIPIPSSSNGSRLGSIGTIGGQNYFDVRNWNSDNPVIGTFSYWLSTQGQFYNTDTMAKQLTNDITKYPNVTLLYGYDIQSFGNLLNPYRISQLYLRSIIRDENGVIQWGPDSMILDGSVFVDASDDGRLTRIANFCGTVGRFDWPKSYLETEECSSIGQARQQAATLLFKVTGVQIGDQGSEHDMCWVTSEGVHGVYGGITTYKNNQIVKRFNDTYGPKGFAIKPLNAAQDGMGSDAWWINTLLVFNVDGRANDRDLGSPIYPCDKRADYKTVDDAWVHARNFIKNTPEFLQAFKQFAGFQNVELVTDTFGNPEVGEVLYLRETIHLAKSSKDIANSTENTNYALTADQCSNAGATSAMGNDLANYNTRVGLNYYWSDINAYQFEDIKDKEGNYIWGWEVGNKLRPDMNIRAETPIKPVYVPLSALTTNYVANLLVPGYATGASSFAWAEVRVIPNLCVLGDAAGVVAAYAVNNGLEPLYLSTEDIAKIQNILIDGCKARLDK